MQLWIKRVLTTPLGWVVVVLIALVIVFSIRYQLYVGRLDAAHTAARDQAMLNANSGRQFDLEGSPVQSRLVVPSDKIEVRRGDSVVVVYRIEARKRGDESHVANEAGAHLTPTLTAGDCAVTAQTPGLTKATNSLISAFVWQWSIDDCKTVGYKAVQLLVAFDGSRAGSDPIADRELAFVNFADPFSLQDAITALAVVSGTLTALSLLVGLVGPRKDEKQRAT